MTRLTRLVTTDELQLYKILLDETRESLLDHLTNSPKGWTASELSEHFGLKLPTIMSHLRKLEQVGAIAKHKRKGKNVNRTVVYYKASVRVGGFKERLKQAETALDQFKRDVSEAIFKFLQQRGEVIPSLDNPTDLLEWLELLLKRTASSVAELIVQQPEQLTKSPKLQPLAVKIATIGLLNDCWFEIFDALWESASRKDRKLADIAKKYGIRRLKSGTDAIFVLEVVEDLLSKNDSKRLRAQVSLTQLVDLLPPNTTWKKELQEILPYLVRARELLDDKSAASLYEFEVPSINTSSMIARWRKSSRMMKEALQPIPVAAK